MIRSATLADLDALVRIENRCFDIDRLSRRSFRHLLSKGHARTLVFSPEDAPAQLAGYVMVLYHQGTSLARIYSLAVDPDLRGRGAGRHLVEAAESDARDRGCASMRLEVRRDNGDAIALYRRLNYREFGIYQDYYEDHMEALRFEKRLVPQLALDRVTVPYYRQTLDFTCGPSALMMAMGALRPDQRRDRTEELRIWREATTIFMTNGHGGCGPYGLALAAIHRGFGVEIYLNAEGALFVDSVRSPEKKVVIELVQDDFVGQLRELGVPIHFRPLTLDEMHAGCERGDVPLVLISSYRIYREKFPHWVVVTGFDAHFIYVHDPYVDDEIGKTETDCVNLPIPRREFERMARYGKLGLRAALMVHAPSAVANPVTGSP